MDDIADWLPEWDALRTEIQTYTLMAKSGPYTTSATALHPWAELVSLHPDVEEGGAYAPTPRVDVVRARRGSPGTQSDPTGAPAERPDRRSSGGSFQDRRRIQEELCNFSRRPAEYPD